eukprot:757088-Hanusia_phi.AAC.6
MEDKSVQKNEGVEVQTKFNEADQMVKMDAWRKLWSSNSSKARAKRHRREKFVTGTGAGGEIIIFHTLMGVQESKTRYHHENRPGLESLCTRTTYVDECRANSHDNPERSKLPSGTEKLIASFGSPLHAAAVRRCFVIGYPSDINMLYEAGHQLELRDAGGRTA